MRMGRLAMCVLLAAGTAWAQPEMASWVSTEDLAHTLSPRAPLTFAPGTPAAETVITVEPATTYQVIDGLGSSLEHSTCANLARLDPAAREAVVTRLFSPDEGIGINLSRICMGTPDFTGDPWYTYDDMPPGEKDPELARFSIDKDRAYILPVLKLALEKNPDLRFFATPWSPPGWMKTCDDLIGGHLYPRWYGAYARYFVKFIEAYAAEGIPIHAVTVQNEPGVNKRDDVRSWWYPSCQWSLVEDEDTWWPVPREIMGHPERDFIRDHLGPAFREHGLDTRIWCFDHNFNNPWYPRNILSDPGAAQYVEGAAFHPYGGRPEAMSELLAEFPDKKVFLSEGSVYGVRGALEIIDFLRNGASAYNAWVTILDTEGKPNNGPFDADRTCVTIDADTRAIDYHFDYYMYGQFMRFIPRGAVRIDSGAPGRRLGHVAFRTPDGALVLVVVNADERPRTVAVACQGQHAEMELPARAVVTCRWCP